MKFKQKIFFKDISEDVELMFDTSNFPKEHSSGIPFGKNKKVIGMMKDEAGGKIIEEFVGLRAKLYSYKMLEGKEEKSANASQNALRRKRFRIKTTKTACSLKFHK